jgi:pentatricopeptide repeat protein
VFWTIASFTFASLGVKRQTIRATIILVVYVLLVMLWLVNIPKYRENYTMTLDAKFLIVFAITSQMVQFALIIADVHLNQNDGMPYLEMTAPANWASFAWIFFAVAEAAPKRFNYTLNEQLLIDRIKLLEQSDSYSPNPNNDLPKQHSDYFGTQLKSIPKTISACGKGGQWEKGLQLLEEMQAKGV